MKLFNSPIIPSLIFEHSKYIIKCSFLTSLIYLCQMIVLMTDTYFISQLGVSNISASGYATRFYMPMFLLVLGFSIALFPLIPKFLVKNNYDEINHIFSGSIWFGLIISIIFAIICNFFIYDILILLKVKKHVAILSKEYMTYFSMGLPFFHIILVLRNIFVIFNFQKIIIKISFLIAVINFVFDYVFVNYFDHDFKIKLIGLATLISNFIGAALILIYFKLIPAFSNFKFIFNIFSIRNNILKISIPISLKLFFENLYYTAIFVLIGYYGIAYSSAYQIGLQIETSIIFIMIGFGVTITSNVAKYNELNDKKNLINFSISSILITTLLPLITSCLIYLFRDDISKIFFTDTTELGLKTVQHFKEILFVFIFMMIIIGTRQFITSFMNGVTMVKRQLLYFIITNVLIGVFVFYITLSNPQSTGITIIWGSLYILIINLIISYLTVFFYLYKK